MQWILLAVIVVALLYLSRFYPKVAFALLGVLVMGTAVIVFTTTDVAQRHRSRLPVADLKIENPIITSAYGDGFRLNARLLNTHESVTLKSTIISITMLDCAEDAGEFSDDCQVIGQEDQRVIVNIPPGQVRDIARTLSFNSAFGLAKPLGTLRWRIEITETRS